MLYGGRPSVIRLRCGMMWSGMRLADFQVAIHNRGGVVGPACDIEEVDRSEKLHQLKRNSAAAYVCR